MTTHSSTMSNYTDAIANLPEEAFLGSLLWFSISQADVNLAEARATLEKLGLKTGTMRKVLRPVDAFRKASREIAHKFPTADSVRSEFLVRQAGEDPDESYRHIILERADWTTGKKRKLVYEKVGEVVLVRGQKKDGEYTGHSIRTVRTTMNLGTPLTTAEDEWLTNQLAGFETRFEHLLHFMDSHAVRSFVRDYIVDWLSGTCVKESGGVYFVKQEHAAEIKALGEWVRSIDSDFHTVPLLNLTDQRQMILAAFEDETIKEVERLMGEVAKILQDPDRQIEDKTFDQYGLRAAELSLRVDEYNKMLGSRADRAAFEISTYASQVMQLAGRIKPTAKPTQ